MTHNLNEYLEFATRIAYNAGGIMLKYFNKSDISKFKEDKTIVTLADTEINNHLISEVKKHYPTHGVFGEEKSYNQDSVTLWVCDPVDGTANFARGIPVFAFSLALDIDGETKLGVVYDPIMKNLYTAIKGKGAFKNGKEIKVKPLTLEDLNTIGSISSRTESFPFIAEFTKQVPVKNYLARGAIVLSAMHIAESITQFHIARAYKKENFVDIAAAQLIIKEAGGKVTNLDGKEIFIGESHNGLIASNGLVHDELLQACKVVQQMSSKS